MSSLIRNDDIPESCLSLIYKLFILNFRDGQNLGMHVCLDS